MSQQGYNHIETNRNLDYGLEIYLEMCYNYNKYKLAQSVRNASQDYDVDRE